MPRKWQETVKPFDPLENKFYPVEIKIILKSKNGKEITVTLEHIQDDTQLGRIHELSFKLPIRPSGLTRDFFIACGLDLGLNQKITPTSAIGSKIMAQFSLESDGETYRAVAFQPLPVKKSVPEEPDNSQDQNRLNL